MVIDKIRKMTVKGVKLKSESFFLISPGVLELWRKNLGGRIPPPPPPAWIGLRQGNYSGIAVLQGVPKKVSIISFYSDPFTTSIHSF